MKRTPLKSDPEKVRAWQKRSRKSLKRGGPLPSKNVQRQKRRAKLGEVYGPHWRWVATLPCLLLDRDRCEGAWAGHHVKTVGSGGRDAGNVVPLCRRHHRQIHALGPVRFNDRWDLDVFAIAKALDV